jgi:hypothetical protein
VAPVPGPLLCITGWRSRVHAAGQRLAHVFWLVMIPVSLLTGWISSVTYVAALSLWALVSGHLSAWQAARVEVRQDEEAKRAEEEPVEQRVVEKLVEETTVELAAGK